MKTVISILWQTGLMMIAALAGFVAGMTVPAIRVSHIVSRTATHLRTYDFNWVIAVLLVYAVLLLVGAARKRLRETFLSATVAAVITIAGLALFTQLGVKDISL